jgi:hypothetical protein
MVISRKVAAILRRMNLYGGGFHQVLYLDVVCTTSLPAVAYKHFAPLRRAEHVALYEQKQ